MTSAYQELSQVTELLYAKERQAVAAILEEEAIIRGQLARLDRMVAQARADAEADTAYLALGADLHWNEWTVRTRRALNADLARVMARKLKVLDRLRRAFGRCDAVDRLEADRQRSVKEARAREDWEKIAALMVLR
ncbi:hypothetical protein [Chachezhania antarctica]|uniref:hypothetical protein n=1 Tax=Chachezhania antarctica TaxID=2340860 RepID=UPI000EAE539E|nr:hypothetical protein [Chachezhania antarctica]|tara:strand:+ start:8896 stop:9303 length:408 start_codon:yes stop_codon:yes gene_type:complete